MVTTIRLHLYQKNNRGDAYGLPLFFCLIMICLKEKILFQIKITIFAGRIVEKG